MIVLNRLVILIFAVGIVEIAYCQQRIVHGDVKNYKTQEPIQGALIQLLKTENKVYTDSLGFFDINVPKEHRSIMISHDDFNTSLC